MRPVLPGAGRRGPHLSAVPGWTPHRNWRRLAAAGVLFALATPALGAHAQPAADAQPVAPPARSAPPVPDPRVAPELLAVPVSSPAYDAALRKYEDAQARRVDAESRLAAATSELTTLEPALARLHTERDAAVVRRAEAAQRLERLRHEMQDLAVANYVHGGTSGAEVLPLSVEGFDENRRRTVVVRAVNETKLGEVAAATTEMHDAEATVLDTTAQIDDVTRRIDEARVAHADAERDGTAATADLQRFSTEVADARLEADVDGLDLRFVVLDAYMKAASGIAFMHPDCGIRWSALAGIGRTESRHGTFGGAVVQRDGLVSKPIIGIPLDGTNDTAVITDSDAGALDGDVVHDRAVGPMQFIPGTWRALGLDGNGDGIADPQNIYDAALSAANLLCRVGPLVDDDRLRTAFLRYNNSNAYAAQVLERTHGYDLFVIPPPA